MFFFLDTGVWILPNYLYVECGNLPHGEILAPFGAKNPPPPHIHIQTDRQTGTYTHARTRTDPYIASFSLSLSPTQSHSLKLSIGFYPTLIVNIEDI